MYLRTERPLIDYIPAEQRAHLDSLVKEGKSIPPIPLEVFGVTAPALVDFVTPRLTLQPWRTFYEPVQARPLRPDMSVAYVYCSAWQPSPFILFYERLKADPGVRTAVIDTGHHCMLSEPQRTIEVLASLA